MTAAGAQRVLGLLATYYPGLDQQEDPTPEIVRFLLEGGLSASELDEARLSFPEGFGLGFTPSPLRFAAEFAPIEIVQALLGAGASLSAPDARGAVLGAAAKNRPDIIHLLVNLGADPSGVTGTPNSNGWTALHETARRGHVEATEMLLRLGANPMQRSDYGGTPIQETWSNRNPVGQRAVRRLLQAACRERPEALRTPVLKIRRRSKPFDLRTERGVAAMIRDCRDQPEWAFTAVKGPIGDVTRALAARRPGWKVFSDTAGRAALCEGFTFHVVRLAEVPWTLVLYAARMPLAWMTLNQDEDAEVLVRLGTTLAVMVHQVTVYTPQGRSVRDHSVEEGDDLEVEEAGKRLDLAMKAWDVFVPPFENLSNGINCILSLAVKKEDVLQLDTLTCPD